MPRLRVMSMPLLACILLSLLPVSAEPADAASVTADAIYSNAEIWTADPKQPMAEALAVLGNRIVAVGTAEEIAAFRGSQTTDVDLKGAFLIPGFVDGHTHFENATTWFFEVLMIDVDSEAHMAVRLREAAVRVPPGLWITGGDWGEKSARKAIAAGDDDFAAFNPTLATIDKVTPNHPVLLRKHDGNYFANSKALEYLRIGKFTPDPSGGVYGHDPETGELTGMLYGKAGDRARLALPPPSRARSLIASRALVKELNSYGITGIHDVARIDEVSQRQIYRTHVERSYSDMALFNDLRRSGDLTVRVFALLPLESWEDLISVDVRPWSGDEFIQFGGLKSFVDGSMMFDPFSNNENFSGDFTFRVHSAERFHDLFLNADAAGYDMATHVIGDRAIALYLDWLEEAIERNGERDRRPRLIHMEYPRESDIRRAGQLGAFADMTPIHMIMDIEDIDERLGPERSRLAYPGRSLIDNGVTVNLVSDLPGGYYKVSANPLNPLENIFIAVERRTPSQSPDQAWHPKEGLTIEEGLRGYTINPVRAAKQEDILGTISVGKLADFAVLDRNILEGTTSDVLRAQVLMTVVGGKTVFQAGTNH